MSEAGPTTVSTVVACCPKLFPGKVFGVSGHGCVVAPPRDAFRAPHAVRIEGSCTARNQDQVGGFPDTGGTQGLGKRGPTTTDPLRSRRARRSRLTSVPKSFPLSPTISSGSREIS